MAGWRTGRSDPDELEWVTRPHEPDEPARHVAELSERGRLRPHPRERLALRAGRAGAPSSASAPGGDVRRARRDALDVRRRARRCAEDVPAGGLDPRRAGHRAADARTTATTISSSTRTACRPSTRPPSCSTRPSSAQSPSSATPATTSTAPPSRTGVTRSPRTRAARAVAITMLVSRTAATAAAGARSSAARTST